MVTTEIKRLGEMVTELDLVRERVSKGTSLSFAPFAQAALLKDRVVSCFSNHQQLACWESIVVVHRILARDSGVR
jgi:hypothetical protein